MMGKSEELSEDLCNLQIAPKTPCLEVGNIMVWGCSSEWETGKLHIIEGRMNGKHSDPKHTVHEAVD